MKDARNRTTDWTYLKADLLRHFPELRDEELDAHRADPGAIAHQLSRRHDLTLLEAEDTLDLWLTMRGLRRTDFAAAA